MQTIIFDMDGVIVDSEPLHILHLYKYLRGIGIKKPETFKRDLKGVNAKDTWDMFAETFELPYSKETLIKESRISYIKFLDSLEDLPVIPGVVDLVKLLHKTGYRLSLASSASPKRIDLFLKKLGLKKYFEIIVSGDDVNKSKPEPDIFLRAAELMEVNPVDCVVIEDANNGVRAAKSAGMKCIAYAGSIHNNDDLRQADLIIKDFETLSNDLKNGRFPILERT